jgi:hypothetical protein
MLSNALACMKTLFKVLTLLVKHRADRWMFASVVGVHLIAWIVSSTKGKRSENFNAGVWIFEMCIHWALQEKGINK